MQQLGRFRLERTLGQGASATVYLARDKVSVKCLYHLSLALMHSLVDRLALGDERLVQAG